MKKHWLLILFIVMVLGVSTYAIIDATKRTNLSEKGISGMGGVDDIPSTDWKTPLYDKAIELFNSVIDESQYNYNENGEYQISFYDLKNNYSLDFSMFNTEEITCNMNRSVVRVNQNKLGPVITIDLQCTKKGE